MTADDALDIVGARLQFGQYLSFALQEKISVQELKALLQPYAVKERGFHLIAEYASGGNACRFDFGDDWRIIPDDVCLNDLAQRLGRMQIVY